MLSTIPTGSATKVIPGIAPGVDWTLAGSGVCEARPASTVGRTASLTRPSTDAGGEPDAAAASQASQQTHGRSPAYNNHSRAGRSHRVSERLFRIAVSVKVQ